MAVGSTGCDHLTADVCSYIINLTSKPMQVFESTSFSQRSKALDIAGAISFHLWSAKITGSGKYLTLTRRYQYFRLLLPICLHKPSLTAANYLKDTDKSKLEARLALRLRKLAYTLKINEGDLRNPVFPDVLKSVMYRFDVT